jgi:hypothetical protein
MPHSLTDEPLSQDSIKLLEDVLAHQDDSLRARYKRLRLSVDKGTSLKNHLVENGVLEEQEVKIGRTRKVLLRVAPAARARLGLTTSLGRGSLTHEYWKRFYAERLKGEDYDVQLEAPRENQTGRVDVLAKKAGESIAVEIETGKSDVVWNVKQDLLSRFSKVRVVPTDGAALRRVEGQLARAGLLVPTRVEVVLRDRRVDRFHSMPSSI